MYRLIRYSHGATISVEYLARVAYINAGLSEQMEWVTDPNKATKFGSIVDLAKFVEEQGLENNLEAGDIVIDAVK